MALRSVAPAFASVLSSAGFEMEPTAGELLAIEVYRLPARGEWVIEARDLDGEGAQVELGLVLRGGDGGIIGPVHRAFSPAALEKALPKIVSALASLASEENKVKCAACGSWTVLKTGRYGPFLSCDQARRVRRTFDGMTYKDLACRGTVALKALWEYR